MRKRGHASDRVDDQSDGINATDACGSGERDAAVTELVELRESIPPTYQELKKRERARAAQIESSLASLAEVAALAATTYVATFDNYKTSPSSTRTIFEPDGPANLTALRACCTYHAGPAETSNGAGLCDLPDRVASYNRKLCMTP